MKSAATTPTQYISELPEDRKEIMTALRKVISKNLPKGFTEVMAYGMIGFVVPHSIYPNGYHCDKKQPLPFINLASQKNFVAVYHMGLYADIKLLNWFTEEYKKQGKSKLDMGKSCLRFKKKEQVPFELIGNLVSRMTPQEWINLYESLLKK